MLELQHTAQENAMANTLNRALRWQVAADAATGFLLTCTRLGWTPVNAGKILARKGNMLTLVNIAPTTTHF